VPSVWVTIHVAGPKVPAIGESCSLHESCVVCVCHIILKSSLIRYFRFPSKHCLHSAHRMGTLHLPRCANTGRQIDEHPCHPLTNVRSTSIALYFVPFPSTALMDRECDALLSIWTLGCFNPAAVGLSRLLPPAASH